MGEHQRCGVCFMIVGDETSLPNSVGYDNELYGKRV